MNIQGDYGNPIHGVSKQPDARMFKGQSRELVNCRCDPTKGLSRRSPWEYVALLQTTSLEPLTDAKWRAHERGDGSAILFAFAKDSPRLWDLEGKSLPFLFDNDNAKNYYTFGSADLLTRFGLASVLDTTFITNREMIPRGMNTPDKVEKPNHFIWLEFKTFDPGSQWVVEVDGFQYGSMLYKSEDTTRTETVTETDNDGNVTHREVTVVVPGKVLRPIWDGWYKPDDTEAIKRQNESYQGSYNAETFMLHWAKSPRGGFSVYRYNNWIGIKRNPASNDLIPVKLVEGSDSIVMHDNRDIKAIEKLPAISMEDIKATVTEGQGAEKYSGYFKSSLNTMAVTVDGFGPCSWKETVNPGSRGSFVNWTMPHVIQFNGVNWVMKQQVWKDRQVGDKDNNPYPSFILNRVPIQSVGLFQNRVFYGAGEALMFSATDSYEDLWVESAYYHTDADPFELIVDSDKVNNIRYAGTFDKDLIFFSQNGQFIMPGNQTHTYDKAYVQTATNYQADLNADPVLAGDNILFAYSNGSYVGIREYFTDNVSGSQRSTPTTNHVDSYMLGSVSHLAGSTSIDGLFVMLKGKGKDVYVNEWMREGTEKVQNAWHRWNIADGLEYQWVGFIGPLAYAVVKDAYGAHHLLRMRWDTPASLYGLPFTPYLDCMREVKMDHKQGEYSVYKVPFDSDDWVFIEGKEAVSQGYKMHLVKLNAYEWGYKGDYDLPLIAGIPFRSSWFPAMPRVTDQKDTTQEMQRMQLSTMMIHFTEVGEAKLVVSAGNGRERVNYFVNRRLDRQTNKVDYINTKEDSWLVAIRQNVTGLDMELYTEAVTPMTIRGAEWSGEYRQQGRRV